ncbi:MAG: ferritin family protein [Planctomycetota bacterium]|nr:ferritin family protein [Planctomycetota bacterium]
MGPLKVIRDRGQDRTRPSPFRDVAARPTTPTTRGLPPVARGRARRGALRVARHQVADSYSLAYALDRAIAEEERMERWLEYVSRRVEAQPVKSFLHRMALEDRDHGRILRRHRADLEDGPSDIALGAKRPPLPTHIEIRGEMGYYRALLTAVQMKAEAAEYYRKLAPAADNRYLRTFLQILANREEEQRDVLADMLDAQRGIGFGRTKSGKIIPPTPDWLGIYLLDEPEM